MSNRYFTTVAACTAVFVFSVKLNTSYASCLVDMTPVQEASSWKLGATSLLKPLKAAEFELYWLYNPSDIVDLNDSMDTVTTDIEKGMGIFATNDFQNGGVVFEAPAQNASLDGLDKLPNTLTWFVASPKKLKNDIVHEYLVTDWGQGSEEPLEIANRECGSLAVEIKSIVGDDAVDLQWKYIE